MPPRRNPQPFPGQLFDLFLIELSNWRWSWRSMVILSVIAPLLSMLGLWVFARDSGGESLAYILTGNVVLSLMFGMMDKVQSHFMFMRYQGTLDYFASLPIHKLALLTAVVAAFFVMALPALVITIILGSWLLSVPLQVHPLIVLVVPLTALPLAGLGALVATWTRDPVEAGTLSTLLTFILLGLGPVIVPPDRLPDWLVILGHLSPATYAASALRQTLLGPVTGQLWIDLCVLAAVGLGMLWIVERQLDWRQR